MLGKDLGLTVGDVTESTSGDSLSGVGHAGVLGESHGPDVSWKKEQMIR